MGFPLEAFLPNLSRSRILKKKFFCLILALFMIFISSVGSKCLMTFYRIMTGAKEASAMTRDVMKEPRLKGVMPRNPGRKMRQIT